MYTSVDSKNTRETIGLLKQIITDYQENGINNEEFTFMKNTILRSHLRAYEDIRSQVQLLRHVSKYELPHNYLQELDTRLSKMDIKLHCELASKYLKPEHLYYVIAGDSTTQYNRLINSGLDMPILIK